MNDDALQARFWSKVDIRSTVECWNWKASCYRNGYGQFGIGYKKHLAHRVAYRLQNGGFDEVLLVCHACDNRKCCNPAHLFLGTQSDNLRDMSAKGRCWVQTRPDDVVRGQDHYNCKLSESDVTRIRALRSEGVSLPKLASMFSIGTSQVYRIVNGESWGWLT